MPYKSRKFRSKSRKYRRTYRKRYARPLAQTRIKRTCALAANIDTGVASDNVITNAAARSQGYFNFSLSDLPNNGEITALYSLYKITGVKLRFIPLVGTDASAGATTFMDTFAYSIDKSVRTVPVNQDELLEMGNCKVISAAAKPFKVWIPYPKAASTIGGTSAAMSTPWLDSDANTIKHYGLRYSFGQNLTTAAVRFQVYATYYLKVRTLK